MEVTKFWTKTKIIILIVILALVAIITGSIFIYRGVMKKKYMALEPKFNNAINNYLRAEKLELTEDNYIETDIKKIIKKGGFVTDDLAKDCDGYVISEIDNNKTYLTCKDIYTTANYGAKSTDKVASKQKSQTEKDTTKPVITLFGSETVTTSLGKKYKDKGATAKDNVDGDLTDKIKTTNDVDTTKEGTYKVTYTVKDKAGNTASKERTVIVEVKEEKDTKDITPPIITFLYDDTYQRVCLNDKVDVSKTGVYGYTAHDDVDGDITSKVKVSTTSNNKIGTYTIKYSVKDKAGNEVTAERNYDIVDCTPTPDPTPTPTPTPTPQPQPQPQPTPDPTPQPPTVTPSDQTEVDTNVRVYPSSIDADDTYYVRVNGTTQIYASVLPSNATDKSLYYSSNDSRIATVSATGLIRGVSRGSTTITIRTSNGKSLSVYVIVE